jgi:integrase
MTLRIEKVKMRKDNTVLLRLIYTQKTVACFSTGIRIPLDKFNPKSVREPVKAGHPNRNQLNREVNDLCDQIMDLRSQIVRENRVPTGEYVAERFKEAAREESTSKDDDPILSSMLTLFFANNRNLGKSRKAQYEAMMPQLTDCLGKIRVSQMNLDRWNKFEDYLFKGNGRPRKVNTVRARLKLLGALMKFLRSEGLQFPLKKYSVPKEEIKEVSLEATEIEVVKDYIPKTEVMQRIKDVFLFQCRTGFRIEDYRRLNLEHIKLRASGRYYIEMLSGKTDTLMTIPLFDTTAEILKRYDFRLPVPCGYYYNKAIRKLLKAAGINRLVKGVNVSDVFTNHCCSRIAIEYFFGMGYSPAKVASIVGKKLPTIMKYYSPKSTSNEILDQADRIDPIENKARKAA